MEITQNELFCIVSETLQDAGIADETVTLEVAQEIARRIIEYINEKSETK